MVGRKPPSRKGEYDGLHILIVNTYNEPGSMADVPRDLLDEITRLEELFKVDTEKLKEITNHFVSELTKGKYHPLHHKNCVLTSIRAVQGGW